MSSSVLSQMAKRTPPVLVVLGATGAGKSKLALQLAQRFGGEIVNCDAMQTYRGLDIVTNKVSAEEQAAARHHLIDFVDPLEVFTVVDFRNRAVPLVERMLAEGKMPVICGGTNYYMESILWKILVADEVQGLSQNPECPNKRPRLTEKFPEEPESGDRKLWERLHKIDPERAAQIHPNDHRKILRSLQVFEQTGRLHSELLREQRESDGGGRTGGPLRFKNCLFLWVKCDAEILETRCDKRVDKMIARGMVKELEDFHADYNRRRSDPADYTRGIFQSIGFKEFHKYLMMDDEQKKSPEGKALFDQGVEQMKLVTRQYSRLQMRWIRRRLLDPTARATTPPLYAVNSDRPEQWDEECLWPAARLLEAVLAGREPTMTPEPMVEPRADSGVMRVNHCPECDRYFQGDEQYRVHLAGRKHKKTVEFKRKQAAKLYATVASKCSKDVDSESRTSVWTLVRSLSGDMLSLKEVKDSLDSGTPLEFQVKVDKSLAEEIAKQLEDAGVETKLLSHEQLTTAIAQ